MSQNEYHESYLQLQEAQMDSIHQILSKCLSDMLKNAHLPKEDNYKAGSKNFRCNPIQFSGLSARIRLLIFRLVSNPDYKVIETESMVLNQVALANFRASSRLVKNLVEREAQRALQIRLDFSLVFVILCIAMIVI